MTRAELIQYISANIYPNGRNQVTAPMVRDSILAVVAFLGDAAVKGIGSVSENNQDLVTGGAVWDAIRTYLSSVMRMVGTTTTPLSDGSTTNPVVINGDSYLAATGDVVVYGSKEFWWTGTYWEELGDEASWALKTIEIKGEGDITGGGNLTQNRFLDLTNTAKEKLTHGETAFSWFEDGAIQGLLQLKNSHSYLGPRKGLIFDEVGENEASDADLYVKEITVGNSTQRVLYSPLPLITEGDQIVVDGTPGGGGGGGGVGYLYQLGDVYPSSKPATQKILVFDPNQADKDGNLGAWVYANMPTGSVTSISVNGQTYSPSGGVVTLPNYPTIPSTYAWSAITGTPTTLGGYGITDAKIANGVITLGSNSITPLTSHQTIYGLTLKVGTITIGSYTPNSAAQTLTVTAQNLYDTIGSTKYHPYGGSTTLTTFNIGGATFTWHPESSAGAGDAYLELNSAFVTSGDQIVGGGTPGGGGGGAGYLTDLLDVYPSTKPSAQKILVFDPNQNDKNGNSGAWVYADMPSGSVTSVAGVSPVNGDIPVASLQTAIGLGDYLPLSGGTMTADAAISWGTNDRTDWDTYVNGIRVMSSASTSSGAPTQYATAISVKARYSFQLAVQGGDYDNFYIRAKTRSWMQILHSGNYASYTPILNSASTHATSSSVIYAPTSAGVAGQILISLGSGAPAWTTVARGASNKPIYINSSGVLTEGVGCLPLSAGSSYPLTGDLYLTAGKGIQATGAKGLLVYHPATDTWTGVSNTQWAVGALDSQGVIRSGNNNLIHYRNGTNYTIWDGSNAGTSTTAWTCSTLTANGSVTIYESSSHTYRWNLNFNGAVGRLYAINDAATAYNDILINNTITVTSGYNVGIGITSPSYKLQVNGDIALKNTGVLRGYDTGGTARTMIGLDDDNAMYVGWGVATAGYDSQYCGNNILFKTSTSHTTRMYINSSGNVTIGSSDLASTNYKFYVNGSAFAQQLKVRTASDYGVLIGGSGSNVIDGLAPSDTYGNLHLNYNSTGNISLCYGGGSGGNVGIGTTSPSYKLHVDGSAAATTLKALSTSAEAHLAFGRANLNYITAPASGFFGFVSNGKTISSANCDLIINNGAVNVNGYVTIKNNYAFRGYDTGGTARTLLSIDSGNGVYVAYGAAGAGYNTYISGNNIYLYYGTSHTTGMSMSSEGVVRFNIPSFTNFQILRTASGGSAAITYYPANQTTNYWVAGVDPGTSYQFFWYYNGAYKAYLSTSGTLTTTGDQVISSDINLKENLAPVAYGVEDIAKTRAVTFDWKDGRGKSAGSIAQDWKPLIPELVHGEEGNMTLAYGQIALVNTIILAKHETEQDKEIKKLKARVKELEARLNIRRI